MTTTDTPAKGHPNRIPITISVMLATLMASLDTTIANVALPHIQGALSASVDQITWVLTSYIVAATIMIPLTGFLADRVGHKTVFVVSITGFTIASMLCGIATNLPEMVVFRLLQGVCGAALIPLSQAVMLDINPPERHGSAMAMWGAGAVLGPVLGPALGGWLTENLDWRWVFFINLPIGALALTGVLFFMSEKRAEAPKRFDLLGFASLAVAVGAFQLMLDRGPGQDWLGSAEIWAYLIVAIIALWVTVVQQATADRPFVDRALMGDRNFVTACIFSVFVGALLFSSLALLPPMMQVLLGYPVGFAGYVSMARGVGMFLGMFAIGQIIGRFNVKHLIFAGLAVSVVSLWLMAQFNLQMGAREVVIASFLSGFGSGLIFVPLSTIAFATITPRHRAEGAGLYNFVRNMGGAAGISIMQAMYVSGAQRHNAGLVEHVRPDNPIFQAYAPFIFHSQEAMAGFQALVGRQAAMLAYIDDFRLLLLVTVIFTPLVFVMRTPKAHRPEPIDVALH